MKYEEIYELLQYNNHKGYESNVYMPNEIFEDLQNYIKNTPHIAFAYSYYYLITWLYRYCKFSLNNGISNSTIKEILGYSADTRSINYLIKKNGLLDQIEYTSTTRDFPVWWNADQIKYEELEFTLVNEVDNVKDENGEIKKPRNYSYEYSIEKTYRDSVPKNFTIKYPEKAFARFEDEEGKCEEGTFYKIEYTHNIPFEVFMYCMSNDDIGCTGFYLYAFLKHKNDIYGDYDISLEDLAIETGIADRTLDKYLGMLKSYKMIDFTINQEFFAIGLKKEDRMANTYSTKDYIAFKDKPEAYDKIKIVKKKDYLKMLEEEEEKKKIVWGEKIDIALEDLPY
ncbi:hypothetical protein CJ195_21860 [Bacillus sp. UMB0899]|uniref:hypothetical protein n=1 Tax=Metabacillus sp. YM-086 TaxID=3341729 RepID=UPI000C808DF5|nr:hypothetical protein CJ195_21860 [Bacillus sp. UMB0899]